MNKLFIIFSSTLLITQCTSPFTSATKLIKKFGHLNHRHFTIEQRTLIAQTIQSFQQCKLLIIGTGLDSGLWMNINKRGITLFLEDNDFWIEQCTRRFPGIQILKVTYSTQLTDWESYLKVPYFINYLPGNSFELLNYSWDVIIIDGPESHPAMPDCLPPTGRMQAFFLAHTLFFNAKEPIHLFMHDTDRHVEKTYAEKLFDSTYLVQELDNLSYFCSTHKESSL